MDPCTVTDRALGIGSATFCRHAAYVVWVPQTPHGYVCDVDFADSPDAMRTLMRWAGAVTVGGPAPCLESFASAGSTSARNARCGFLALTGDMALERRVRGGSALSARPNSLSLCSKRVVSLGRGAPRRPRRWSLLCPFPPLNLALAVARIMVRSRATRTVVLSVIADGRWHLLRCLRRRVAESERGASAVLVNERSCRRILDRTIQALLRAGMIWRTLTPSAICVRSVGAWSPPPPPAMPARGRRRRRPRPASGDTARAVLRRHE